ncbi:hypothetical protein EVAR_77389_1 [Eumeta japonica]|uniref:Uncharacterized protein n=1 Tax=Eumeta variegata TaxID=151549 RepID=A0A4C1UX63_EUMVA|nr:hypothetical protein EVAR_77389_1 [Eumeta japonica]
MTSDVRKRVRASGPVSPGATSGRGGACAPAAPDDALRTIRPVAACAGTAARSARKLRRSAPRSARRSGRRSERVRRSRACENANGNFAAALYLRNVARGRRLPHVTFIMFTGLALTRPDGNAGVLATSYQKFSEWQTLLGCWLRYWLRMCELEAAGYKIELTRVFILGVYAPDRSKPNEEREKFCTDSGFAFLSRADAGDNAKDGFGGATAAYPYEVMVLASAVGVHSLARSGEIFGCIEFGEGVLSSGLAFLGNASFSRDELEPSGCIFCLETAVFVFGATPDSVGVDK